MSVAVYDAADSATPRFGQLVRLDLHNENDGRPEGIKVVPERDLVFVANEDDDTVSILRRTPDATEGQPAPLQGVQPVSPSTPWTMFVELEHMQHGVYLAAGHGYDQRQPGGLWTVGFQEGRPVVLDALPVELADTELRRSFAIEVDHRRRGVWVVTAAQRAVLVGFDGTVRRTVRLGPIDDPAGAILHRGALWVAAGESLLRVDLDTEQVVPYDTGASQLRSLFRLPDGGLGAALGDGDDGLQLRRMLPEAATPNGFLPLALVTDLPAAELPWRNGELFSPEAVLSHGDDAIVVWPTTDDLDAPQTRLVTHEDALAPARDRRPAEVSAAMPDAPLTLEAGDMFTMDVTTDRPGVAIAEVRPAGGSHRDWTVAAIAGAAFLADGLAPGTSTRFWRAPARDGRYDLRISYVTAGGDRSRTELVAGALVVATDRPASVSIDEPSTSDPTFVVGGQPFDVELDTNRGGTARLLAAPAGTGAFTPLAERDLYGGETIRLQAPAVDPEATEPQAYDLRLELRAGGDAAPVTDDVAAGLVVVADAPAPVTLVSPEPGTSVAAGLTVRVEVSVDQPGTLTWSLVAPDGDGQISLGSRTLDRAGSVFQNWRATGQNGRWDLAVTFVNLAGAVSERVFEDAVILDTPPASATFLTPTTAEPLRVVYRKDAIRVRYVVSSTGSFAVAARRAGTDEWRTLVESSRVVRPGDIQEARLSWGDFPPGGYDLRVTFTNWIDETAVALQPAVIEVRDEAPVFAMVEPTTANPALVRPGEQFRLHAAHDQLFGIREQAQIAVLARPAGTDAPFQPLPSISSLDSWAHVTAPAEPGDYDLRLSSPRPGGQVSTFDEPAALRVSPDAPGAVLTSARAAHPLRLAPGSSAPVRLESRRPGSYGLQLRPAGGGDWTGVGQVTATDAFQRHTVTLAVDDPGSYDLRVVGADGAGVDLQPGALVVGPGPQAPVVITEVGEDLVVIRNVSGAAVEVSGWALVVCFHSGGIQGAGVIPGDTVLGPQERLRFGYPGEVDDRDVLYTYPRTPGGVGLLDHDAALVDSVSLARSGQDSSGNRCQEQAPAPLWRNTSQTIQRDPAGTDTGDNSADFTLVG